MAQDDGYQIRTLPRSGDKKKQQAATQKPAPTTPRWIIYVGTTSAVALAALFLAQAVQTKNLLHPAKQVQQHDFASKAQPKANDLVAKHMQDAKMKREMMVKARQMDYLAAKANNLDLDAEEGINDVDQSRTYGLQFDQEDTAERVYEDLHGPKAAYAETLPEDKINARLANRRWVNEFEKAERIQFIKNFIRSAYERGYEVEIDSNLVVVGVKKITEQKKLNIDQIIDKIAKQGQ